MNQPTSLARKRRGRGVSKFRYFQIETHINKKTIPDLLRRNNELESITQIQKKEIETLKIALHDMLKAAEIYDPATTIDSDGDLDTDGPSYEDEQDDARGEYLRDRQKWLDSLKSIPDTGVSSNEQLGTLTPNEREIARSSHKSVLQTIIDKQDEKHISIRLSKMTLGDYCDAPRIPSADPTQGVIKQSRIWI